MDSGPSAMARDRGAPSRSSITKNGVPSSSVVPTSSISTTWGLTAALAALASRAKRSTSSALLMSERDRHLRATRLPTRTCSASYTSPMPPTPMSRTTR